MSKWTGPDQDHDSWEPRANEHEPIPLHGDGGQANRIQELGDKIFDRLDFTPHELAEYTRLVNDSVTHREAGA